MQWSDSFATGVESIDTQHKSLFTVVEEFHQRLKSGAGLEAIEVTLARLRLYAKFHFREEEALAHRYGYPQAKDHEKTHADLLKKVTFFEEILANNDSTVSIEHHIHDFIAFLDYWLVHHILKTDKALGKFLLEAMAREKAASA